MEQIFTQCKIVTADDVFSGTLVFEDGVIKEISTTLSHSPSAIDLEGDYLLPGFLEIHTDNLEKNIQPRPGVIWPSLLQSALAHDVQVAGAGITTVLDAIAVGGLRESSLRSKIFKDSIEALTNGSRAGLFKADHFLHLRCEVTDGSMKEKLLNHGKEPGVRLISLMDHTPGQRQWRDLEKWRLYHRDKKWSEEECSAILEERKLMQKRYADSNRKMAVEFAKSNGIILASHDDTTTEDIASSMEAGIDIAEFPTTMEAAQSARENGMNIIMGAPNGVRGKSHSGNISTAELAENNLLDGLSSDYFPASLLHASFFLADQLELPLNTTVAMVSANIAGMIGLDDRGELAVNKRADMLRVSIHNDQPVLRQVWKKGVQIV